MAAEELAVLSDVLEAGPEDFCVICTATCEARGLGFVCNRAATYRKVREAVASATQIDVRYT